MSEKVEKFKVKVDEEKFDDILPVNPEMEITKDDIKYAFIPIFDTMREHSRVSPKKMKTFEAAQSFVSTNSDVLSEKMYQTHIKHKTGAALLLGVNIPSNPYMPYKITKYLTMPNDEPNMFEVVAFDNKTRKLITLGDFQYLNCLTEKEYKKIIPQICEMENEEQTIK